MADNNSEEYPEDTPYFPTFFIEEAPRPVCDSIAYLRCHHLQTEGIFRKPANAGNLKRLEELYNQMRTTGIYDQDLFRTIQASKNLGSEEMMLLASSLLKGYFNKSHVPLLGEEIANRLFKLAKYTADGNMEDEEITGRISLIISEIPEPNRAILCQLMSFAREIAYFHNYNRMNPYSLATMLSNGVFSGRIGNDTNLYRYGVAIVFYIITLPVKLYMPKIDNVVQNTNYKP